MPAQKKMFALVALSSAVWSNAVCLPACGARSDVGEIGEPGSPTPAEGDVEGEPVEIAQRPMVRDDPGPIGLPGATAPVVPEPGPDDVPPSNVEPAPVMDPAMPQPTEPTPMVEPEVSAEPEPVPEPGVAGPTSEPLWLYVATTSGALIDLASDARRFDALPVVDTTNGLLTPWSFDGRYLAVIEGEEIVVHDLEEIGQRSAVASGVGLQLFGWVGDHGPLFGYYYEGEPLLVVSDRNGSSEVLASTSDTALLQSATSSATASNLLYETEVDGTRRLFFNDLSGEPSQAVETSVGSAALLTAAAWSDGGEFVVFVGSDGEWRLSSPFSADVFHTFPTLDPPVFVPRTNLVSSFDGTTVELSTLSLSGVAPAMSYPAVSPARFSDDGEFAFYADSSDTGLLRRIDGAELTDSYEIEGFRFECPLTFVAADSFVYRQCGTAERGLATGVISGQSMITMVYDSAREQLLVGPAKRCFVSWGGRQFDVGRVASPLEVEFTRSAPDDIARLAIATDDRAIAWVEGDDDVYWLPLNADCTVSSVPRQVASENEVQALEFIQR